MSYKCKWGMKSAICLILALTLMSTLVMLAPGAQAKGAIEILINGLPLPVDTEPFIANESTYVPIRAITEALGCTVDYNKETSLITIKNASTTVTMTPYSTEAKINGVVKKMPAQAMLISSRVFVPVRFVAETFKCMVIWEDSFDGMPALVKIYTSIPIKSKLGVEISSIMYEYSKDMGEHNVRANICLPQLSGLKDEAEQARINKVFSDWIERDKKDVVDFQKDMVEYGENFEVAFESDYKVYSETDKLLTIIVTGYNYAGGAHGMPTCDMTVIDVEAGKKLALSDLFTSGADYKAKLITLMNKLISANEELRDSMFEPMITKDDLEPDVVNFHFRDNDLIIYYRPYDVGPYASGFIEFPIAKSDLKDILKSQYK